MINYMITRISPAYLSHIAHMLELKEKDKRTWNMMKDRSFCVAKSKVPFTAICADHGIEQENRALNVLVGIKGVFNSSPSLDEDFLTAAEISNIIATFCNTFGILEVSH